MKKNSLYFSLILFLLSCSGSSESNIKKGTELGITHIMVWQSWIRTPLGGFINHSDNPNAKGDNRIKDGVDYRILIITEDVKAGDEITFFYTLDEYKGVSFKTNRL